MFDIGSVKNRGDKIVAGSHSHYFFNHHDILYDAFREIVGAASCRNP
jgi:hypothetical protein